MKPLLSFVATPQPLQLMDMNSPSTLIVVTSQIQPPSIHDTHRQLCQRRRHTDLAADIRVRCTPLGRGRGWEKLFPLCRFPLRHLASRMPPGKQVGGTPLPPTNHSSTGDNRWCHGEHNLGTRRLRYLSYIYPHADSPALLPLRLTTGEGRDRRNRHGKIFSSLFLPWQL